MTPALPAEPILEPDLPIVDAHHHLWFMPEAALIAMDHHPGSALRALSPVFRQKARYLFDEYRADIESGHNVVASVHVDAHTMYRASGPEALKSVGEVEFVNGVAAMAASGYFGSSKICAGIVGGVDLTLGAAVDEVLEAHIQAAGGRYRGVRSQIVYDEDLLGPHFSAPRRLLDRKFRAGFQCLRRRNLSFEAWLLEPQLPELIDLARAFPDTQIILNHVGAPVGMGPYVGKREARFSSWRENIRALARHGNVAVKLGGLGIPFGGFKSYLASPPMTSEELATEWKPYIHTCIDAFGVQRCMFESNFPVDCAAGSYATLWNAFKRITLGASQIEKSALFSGTATRIYRLEL